MWLRLPVLLLRFPGILAAVLAAAAVLAVVAAAGPLFLSSAGEAALQQELSELRNVPGLEVAQYGPVNGPLLRFREAQLARALSGTAGLSASPITTIIASEVVVDRVNGTPLPAEASASVTPVFRTGFNTNIEAIAGSGSNGVWINDVTAKVLGGVKPGDTISLSASTGGPSVPLRVAGVYRNLQESLVTPYWEPLSSIIYPPANPAAPAHPPVMLAEQSVLLPAMERLGDTGRFQWDYPLTKRSLTLPIADGLGARLRSVMSDLVDPGTQLGSAFTQSFQFSPVPDTVQRSRALIGSIAGPIDTLALAGGLLALAGLGVAGVYGSRRRWTEISLLAARGVGPARFGLRAATESVLPVLVGAALGWALGVALVVVLGPSPSLQTSAVQDSVRNVAWSVAAGVALIGLVIAGTSRREETRARGRAGEAVARMPWEWIVLALAAASLYEIVTRGATPLGGGETVHVDRLLLLFPILFVAGVSGLLVRALRGGLGRLRVAGNRWSPSMFLAARRLASAPRAALLLVTAAAVAVGMVAYAGMLADSIRATSQTKALVAVGSATSVNVQKPVPIRSSVGVPVTEVFRVQGQASLAPSGRAVDVLGVDPATFPAAAYWRGSFASSPLAGLLGRLGASSPDRLNVIAAGTVPAHSTLVMSQSGLAIKVVGSAGTFPGMTGTRPMLVVDLAALQRAAARRDIGLVGLGVHYQAWSPAPPDRVIPVLRAGHAEPGDVQTAARFMRTPSFLALSWTFGFLAALGSLAGILAIIGLLLYLQARQRSREVAYALSRRMGLRSGAHRISVMAELASMLGCAFVIGTGLAAAASMLVYRRLDPLPQLPPSPLFRLPLVLLAVLAAGLCAVTWTGAAAVHRQAERVDVAEVMRLAE